MTARAFEETQIEEGQASLDAYESSVLPMESADAQQIDAARIGIRLLVAHILEIQDGKETTCTLQEIGQALVGTKAPPPNWFEKVCLARDQEKLLKQTTRLMQHAMDVLENDIYATRVATASQFLEDALSELDAYKAEGEL